MRKFKFTILALFLSVGVFSQNIITETFDDFSSDQRIAENDESGNWTTWSNSPGSAEDLVASSAFALSDSISALVTTGADAVLKLGTYNSGKYKLSLDVLIEDASMGYFNLLQAFGSEPAWGLEVYFNGNGDISLIAQNKTIVVGTFNYKQWVNFKSIVDIDNDWIDVFVDNKYVFGFQWSLGAQKDENNLNQLEAINFYAPPTSNTGYNTIMYVDNISFDYLNDMPVPTNLSSTISNVNTINLTWDKPDGEVPNGYYILRNNELVGTTLITETSFADKDLYLGNYEYKVKASYNEGLSAASQVTNTEIEGGVDKENVLLEMALNIEYDGCVGAANGANDLLTNNGDLAILQYHIDDKHQIDEAIERFIYYGDEIIPMAYFDGGFSFKGGLSTGSNYLYYLPLYEKAKAVKSDYSMNISYESIVDNVYGVTVNIKKEWQKAESDIVINLALTESNKQQYWQGESTLNNVVVAMQYSIPDMTFTEEETVSFTIDVPEDFQPENGQLIAFIQDNDYVVHQTAKIRLLNAVDSISAAVVGDQVNLNWVEPASTNILNVTGYNIYRDGELIFKNYAYTTYKESGLEPNTTYNYCIEAIYNDKMMAPSTCIEIKTDIESGVSNYGNMELTIHPNPVKDQLLIKTEMKVEYVQLTSITGQTVFKQIGWSDNDFIQVSEFENGIYLLIIRDANNNISTHKIIVEN